MRKNFAVFAACTTLIIACGSKKVVTKTLVIGSVTDQSSATEYTSWITAGNLAVTQLNAALTANNSEIRFKLISEDSTNTSSVAVQRATDLVRKQAAKSVLSDTSGSAQAINDLNYNADTTLALNVPETCVTCSSPAFNNPNNPSTADAGQTDANGWLFRTMVNGNDETTVLDKLLASIGDANHDGEFKISAAIFQNSSGPGFITGLTKVAGSPTVNTVANTTIGVGSGDAATINAIDWTATVAQLTGDVVNVYDASNATTLVSTTTETTPPDVLAENLNPSYLIGLVGALTAAGNTIPFFHSHAFRANQVATTLGSAINGQNGVSPVLVASSPSGKQFTTDFTAVSPVGPGLLDSAYYDALTLNAFAILIASKGLADPTAVTGSAVRDALNQLSGSGQKVGAGTSEFTTAVKLILAGTAINYDGASGPVDFNANGDIKAIVAHYEGVNGKFVDKETYDCITDPSCPVVP